MIGEGVMELDILQGDNFFPDFITCLIYFVEGDPLTWQIDCNNSDDCPEEWLCSYKTCIAPLGIRF